MTVEIVGQLDGDERAAAEVLKKLLEASLRPQDQVTIVVGAKCYGQKKQDIDLLIFGQMAGGFKVAKHLVPEKAGTRTTYLSDFCLVLEVKGHDSGDVRFAAGNQVEVRYRGAWSNASSQVHEQVFSVRQHLLDNVKNITSAPWILQGIWLTRVARSQLQRAAPIVLASDCTFDDLIRLILDQSFENALQFANKIDRDDIRISSGRKEDRQAVLASVNYFTRKIEPSTLDRRKLEAICEKLLKGQKYFDLLGKQLLIFRGRGGAGKTLRLLNIARTVHEEQGARTLLLTYNKALVSDVRRLLAILGVSDSLDQRSIQVQSSTSFFFALLVAWGLRPSPVGDETFPETEYATRKLELLELVRGSLPAALRADPIAAAHPELFAWDYVLVDEGQDWPHEERDLLFAMFGPERIIVADGVDQFVRANRRCDWTTDRGREVGTDRRQIVRLQKSLRLKSNLCSFASSFASACGVEWDMEPNTDVGGGRIKICLGEYTQDIHSNLMTAQSHAKNRPIDALFCVTGESNAPSRGFPQKLISWGAAIWDGTSAGGREDYPRDVDQHRIVKYESCRGLEGWSVVCLDLDRFFERKYAEGMTAQHDLLLSTEEAALRYAGRWCLIPFTRAIDTLVLQLSRKSRLAEILLPLASQSGDFIEIGGQT